MTLKEAVETHIRTGQAFRVRGEKDWLTTMQDDRGKRFFSYKENNCGYQAKLSIDQMFSDDWELSEAERKLSVSQLKAAWNVTWSDDENSGLARKSQYFAEFLKALEMI